MHRVLKLRSSALAFFIALLFLSSARGGGLPETACPRDEPAPDLGRIEHFIRIPLLAQSRDYTCGVSSLRSVLLYYGEEYSDRELIAALGSNPRNGTSYRSILRFANRTFADPHKRNFRMRKVTGMTADDLRRQIYLGRPVILSLQAWGKPGVDLRRQWDEGHYAVAVGYDENNIYFMDPSTAGRYAYIPIGEFLDRWHDQDPVTGEKLVHWGLVIGNEAKKPVYDARAVMRMR